MKIQRVYCDDQGESHYEEMDIPLSSVGMSPPSPPVDLSVFQDASRVAIMRAPAGWKGDWHPAPCRPLMFYMSGEVVGETSDGVQRRMTAGTVVLLEDTSGKGHRSWVVGTEDVLIGVVELD